MFQCIGSIQSLDILWDEKTLGHWDTGTLGLKVVNHTFFADDIKLINSPQYIQPMLNVKNTQGNPHLKKTWNGVYRQGSGL